MEGQLMPAASAALQTPARDALQAAVSADPNNARRAVFDFNKQILAEAMRSRGIACVTVSYSGGGDEGRIDDTSFEPPDASEEQQVPAAQLQYRWDEERACGASELALVEMRLRDIAEALCEEAISLMGHGGYGNGEGGEGTFTLQAHGAAAELEHSDFHTESDTTTHTL